MQSERILLLKDDAILAAARPPAAGLATLFLRRPRRAGPARALPLADDERRHYDADAFVSDAAGEECFRGLSRPESIDYIALQRIGLDNDDAAFLRLIRLGDRHASAMRFVEPR